MNMRELVLIPSLLLGMSTSQAQNILDAVYIKQNSDNLISALGSQKPLTSSDTAFVTKYYSEKELLALIEFTPTHIIVNKVPIRRESLSYDEVKNIPGIVLDSTIFYHKRTGKFLFNKEGALLVKHYMKTAINPHLDSFKFLDELLPDCYLLLREQIPNDRPGCILDAIGTNYMTLHPTQ